MKVKCISKTGQQHLRGAIRKAASNSDYDVVFYYGNVYTGMIGFHNSWKRRKVNDVMNDIIIETYYTNNEKLLRVYYKEDVCIFCDSFELESY